MPDRAFDETPASMEEVTNISVHEFGSDVLVELLGVDEYGEVATETIEYSRTDATGQTISPRGEVPEEYVDQIRDAVAESGFSLDRYRHDNEID